MLEAAAVVMNGQHLHPEGCYEPALRKWKAQLDELVVKHVGAFDLSLSMPTVSPSLAFRMGQITVDVMLPKRRAAR